MDDRQLGAYFDSVKASNLAATTKRDRIRNVTQLWRWSHSRNYIEDLPRLCGPKAYKVEVPSTEIDVYSDRQVAQILNASQGKARLYVLLALNCGFTQKDISDLTHSEVDLEAGTITRRRSKTRHHENAPTVTYRLWPETLESLNRFVVQGGERVLLNSVGNPLVSEGRKADAIAKAMQTLRANMAREDPITFKRFRSTASTKLGERYPEFTELYLGHSPRTVGDRHYVRPSQERFDEAIAWLGEQFCRPSTSLHQGQ